MAGFAMMGVDYNFTGVLNTSTLTEYRGNSYAVGADTGAITIPSFIKNYNPNVKGGSVLSHAASLCYGVLCGFPLTACSYLKNNKEIY
jgi:phospholipase B1